jgi:hypothetical protein
MQTLVTYIWAMLVSLLPHHYRRHLSMHGSRELWLGAILSSSAQAITFSLVLLLRFMNQISGYMGEAGAAVLGSQTGPTMDVMQVRLATGVLGLLNFVLQPLNLIILYLAVEGVVRMFAAFTLEVLPTIPLYLVSFVHNTFDKAWSRMKLGPLVIDEIQAAHDNTYDLQVLSCRQKPDWNRYITIRFRDEFYVLVGEEIVKGPRPFVYRLRKNPTGRLVVVIQEYRLDDPQKKPV